MPEKYRHSGCGSVRYRPTFIKDGDGIVNVTMLETEFERRREQIVQDWEAFLRFPSISADPARQQDCLDCAEWLAASGWLKSK